MTPRPTADVRRLAFERARGRCEYCLLHQDIAAAAHQVDHITAEKHGGETELDNLALSCVVCNRRKGSDLSSIDPRDGAAVRLFHPREDVWEEHFRVEESRIEGLTPAGRATAELLRLNAFERVLERSELIRAGRFP